jgi:serine/threonine protein kinase
VADTPAAPVEVVPGVFVGGVLNDKFVVQRKVGEGAMGVVVAAHQTALDRTVAIKFLTVDALKDPEAVARFESEVKAASKITNEHVPPVYDTGKTSRGTPYMVLEYLDGENLAQRLARGALGIQEAVGFVVQACHAVQAAHALGIIHRDLKPANLIVVKREGRESVKVLDFGIAKVLRPSGHDLDPHQTRPNTLMGTPLYASPEQLESAADVDVRTDVWSLGATLFHLLCREPPFGGADLITVATSVKGTSPAPLLRSLRPDAPAELEAVVAKCLHKPRESRYRSVAELGLALGKTVELDRDLQGLLDRIELQHRESAPAVADGAGIAASQPPWTGPGETGPTAEPTDQRLVLPELQTTVPAMMGQDREKPNGVGPSRRESSAATDAQPVVSSDVGSGAMPRRSDTQPENMLGRGHESGPTSAAELGLVSGQATDLEAERAGFSDRTRCEVPEPATTSINEPGGAAPGIVSSAADQAGDLGEAKAEPAAPIARELSPRVGSSSAHGQSGLAATHRPPSAVWTGKAARRLVMALLAVGLIALGTVLWSGDKEETPASTEAMVARSALLPQPSLPPTVAGHEEISSALPEVGSSRPAATGALLPGAPEGLTLGPTHRKPPPKTVLLAKRPGGPTQQVAMPSAGEGGAPPPAVASTDTASQTASGTRHRKKGRVQDRF